MGPFTFNVTAAINLWTNAALDLFLSATLILTLRKHVLGFNPSTDNAIRRIMRTAATTASYTAVCSTVAASLSVAWPTESLTGASNFLAFSLAGPSLYALSMLATMAARKPAAQTSVVAGPALALTTASRSTAQGDSREATQLPTRPRRKRVGRAGRSVVRPVAEDSTRAARPGSAGSIACVVQNDTEVLQLVDVQGEGSRPRAVQERRYGKAPERPRASSNGRTE